MTLSNSVQVIAGQVSGTLFNVESARLVELETKVRGRLAASPQCSAAVLLVSMRRNMLSATVCPAFSWLKLPFGRPSSQSPAAHLRLAPRCCRPQRTARRSRRSRPRSRPRATPRCGARDASRTLQALPSEVYTLGLRF